MTQVVITRPLEPAQQLAGQLAEQEELVLAKVIVDLVVSLGTRIENDR